jgi:hypothetical protein
VATVPIKQAVIGGVLMPPTAATAGPDKIAWNEHAAVYVENGNAGAVVVTTVVPGNTKWGPAQPDVASVSIPAGQRALIGPFPQELADSNTGLVDLQVAPFANVNLYGITV